MNVYFLSGIGADFRLFRNIYLPEGFNMIPLEMIPEKPLEKLSDYALRLVDKIDLNKPFALVGLSFGGILATEIAKSTPCSCLVLISSVPTKSQLPAYYKRMYQLKLHRLFPSVFWKISAYLNHYLTTKGWENKKAVGQMVWDGNSRFMRWGINGMLEWENDQIPTPYYHIHGTRDEVFPLKYTKPTHILKGRHMLVMNQHKEVNKILAEILSSTRTDQMH